MGAENSRVVGDNVPPETLSERSLRAVAELIKEGRAGKIVVMTGAGISTAAGIPDFRSPNTGLYANLARLNLPYAEAVFDISYFRQNPEPFYVLAKELYPGKFHPTVSHVFIALLAAKGLLLQLFTQNIDCLERTAGVPGDLIVEAHGSFATQRCIDCGTPYADGPMRAHVARGEVPRCPATPDDIGRPCGGLVKPDIVFFGEALPELFRRRTHVLAAADLVLILGTSLTVHPFAQLPQLVADSVPRVLFNLEQVGGIGAKADDVLVLKECDAGVRELADALGWRDELEEKWREVVGREEAERQLRGARQRERDLEAELSKITDQVETSLKLEDASIGSAGSSDARAGGGAESRGDTPESAAGVTEEPTTPVGSEEKNQVERGVVDQDQAAKEPETKSKEAEQVASAEAGQSSADEAGKPNLPLVASDGHEDPVKREAQDSHAGRPEPEPKHSPGPEQKPSPSASPGTQGKAAL